MLLSTILQNVIPIPAEADREITRLILDSRRIQPNDVFLAVKGTQQDGRLYIPNAIAQGAGAVLLDADQPEQPVTYQQSVPMIPMMDLQQLVGPLAARFYQFPARKMYTMGVTGTNGKTSCTHFIAQVLQSFDTPCGIVGTLGSGMYGHLSEAGLTTPDAVTLQATLNELVEQGAADLAMEVSSHSIDQGRVNGMEFDIGIFTNLTQDHLDYHGNMETYAAVKRRFLSDYPVKHLVINLDDDYGNRWLHELAATRSVYAYSVHPPAANSLPGVYAQHVTLSSEGIRANITSPWGEGEIHLPLIGQFNLSNALAALTALCIKGLPFQQVLKAFARIISVPGRMEALGGQGQPRVVVDFAHTPDALEKVLKALRAHTQGQLICVFGCGGNRDPGKRPLMAKVVEQWADRIIVTNDNPRHERPEDIASQIMSGFSHPEKVTIELNRSQAILNSIQWASAADCVLIAGKGAEHYQQIGDDKFPFDDVEQVKSALAINKPVRE